MVYIFPDKWLSQAIAYASGVSETNYLLYSEKRKQDNIKKINYENLYSKIAEISVAAVFGGKTLIVPHKMGKHEPDVRTPTKNIAVKSQDLNSLNAWGERSVFQATDPLFCGKETVDELIYVQVGIRDLSNLKNIRVNIKYKTTPSVFINSIDKDGNILKPYIKLPIQKFQLKDNKYQKYVLDWKDLEQKEIL